MSAIYYMVARWQFIDDCCQAGDLNPTIFYSVGTNSRNSRDSDPIRNTPFLFPLQHLNQRFVQPTLSFPALLL
ncbi:hypothetical protein PHYBLDRAFT_143181 [Phycomyces blakesleeanus NRRL 1555(-)]|uniref:Uncharacterized protein n=1 Tax=Phycomyces blakesleeanus (strain ATCC 8743b / DSM 1359 / FGSC 10004 / NBRC 33097 / NRRL 1555) TaxID=763407 RepID=A0A162PUT6_PHYB8|nr:hypothetical protein PHYBLDRAFT_143181 [Phycomyces blakesleeanus NRRL 1555(-)]OAD76197.1 hypothetical protein PHYBLDRAFT_143181 [Phycomyces blakesleeanus NRRL 1555(-)]|eukprot:XP_018294237.1 hypothetical protein PHYBLDRAFT_143181 [Phycomyces blakesleeanus NRRL 1555(-)]